MPSGYGVGASLAGLGSAQKHEALGVLKTAADEESQRNRENEMLAAQQKAGKQQLGGTLGAFAGYSLGAGGGAAAGSAAGGATAAAGATAGAEAGSAGGPWGALIGGVVGAIAGGLF